MKILVLGITGMLGNAMLRFFSKEKKFNIFGTTRQHDVSRFFPNEEYSNIITGVNVEDPDSLIKIFANVKPDVVINCIGLVKQLSEVNDPLQCLPINAILPHRLALLAKASGARLIQISTDCVFSGSKGNYLETDFPDADDLYGRSKLLGEVDYPNAITLRTSIIGHELSGNRSLINWFLSQETRVGGYKRAIYSGLPTVELANVIMNYVIPNPQMHGLYHVASDPINKYELLKLVSDVYKKKIEIIPVDDFFIDRSLNAQRFNKQTNYTPPQWNDLVQKMYEFK